MMKRAASAIVLGLFLFAVHFAVAGEFLGAHDETEGCKNVSLHFCADKTQHDPDLCAICQFNAVSFSLPVIEKFDLITETRAVVTAAVSGPIARFEHTSASPRAPPALPL